MRIDGIGKRYGMLPSQVLRNADTFDLYIMDVAMSFENYYKKKANNNGKEPIPELTQQQLQKIMYGDN